jgi:hydrogenase expression/formation protein HypC
VRWVETDPLMALAEVAFGGLTRQCHMACVPEARVGDYVVVHAGVAISVVDADAAAQALAELASLPGEADWPADESERKTGP